MSRRTRVPRCALYTRSIIRQRRKRLPDETKENGLHTDVGEVDCEYVNPCKVYAFRATSKVVLDSCSPYGEPPAFTFTLKMAAGFGLTLPEYRRVPCPVFAKVIPMSSRLFDDGAPLHQCFLRNDSRNRNRCSRSARIMPVAPRVASNAARRYRSATRVKGTIPRNR